MGCGSSGQRVVEYSHQDEVSDADDQQTINVNQSVMVNGREMHRSAPSEPVSANHQSARTGQHLQQGQHQHQQLSIDQQYQHHSHQQSHQPHHQSQEYYRHEQPHEETSGAQGGAAKTHEEKREMLENMKECIKRRHILLTKKAEELEKQAQLEVAASKPQQIVKMTLGNILTIRHQIERNEMMQAKVEQKIMDRMIFKDNYDLGGFMHLMTLDMEKFARDYDVTDVQVAATRLAQAEDRFLIDVQVGEDMVDTGLEFIDPDIY